MKVKFKKLHRNAVIPKYAKPGDAGMDLTAVSREMVTNKDHADYIEYNTGLSIEIPDGYVGLLFPRSSISKKDLTLCNSIGVIDSKYRGEIKLRFKVDISYDSLEQLKGDLAYVWDNHREEEVIQYIYDINDRVGQLIILSYPQIEFEEVEELSDTVRGEGGFGSTNNK